MLGRPLLRPWDVRFEEVSRRRPFALLSPFVEVDEVPGATTRADVGPRVPFCSVVVDVASLAEDGGVECGLAGDGYGILVRYVRADRRVAVLVRRPDGEHEVASAALDQAAPLRLACVVNENRVTALVAAAGTEEWRPLTGEREGVRALLDLRDPDVLAPLRYVYAPVGGAELGRVRAGYSGPIGIRDPQVVRHADGSPVVEDGRFFVTLTNAGLGFFQQAHWSVWSLSLTDPSDAQQVAALFSARDGLVLGDHAGALVRDGGRWILLVSSWGDHDPERGVHVRGLVTDADLLRGVHVLETDRVPLPTGASAWDPSLARVGDRWHLAFVECPSFGPPRYVFHPALAVAAGADPMRDLTLVGAAGDREQTEGAILQRFGDDWYVLASDRDGDEYPVHDLRMQRVGALQAPYGSNIPHPAVVPPTGPDGGWWLVTFDGTPWHEEALGYGTHGDLVVMAGRPPTPRETATAAARSAAGHLPGGVRRRLSGVLRRGR